MNKLFTLTLLAAGTSVMMQAANVDFSYNIDNKPSKVYGFDKKESYDVAIFIEGPEYIGTEVTGLTVDFPVNPDAFSDITGWLSSELRLDNKNNAPDIASAAATVADETLEVSFENPVEITGGGIWVGYSFKITSLDKTNEYDWPGSPVAVIESDSNLDRGLWMHSSRSRLKWTNVGETLGAVSTMTVHLSTKFGPHDVAISVPEESYMVAGEKYTVPFTLINHGTQPLEDITYTYSIGDFSATESLHLDTPLHPDAKRVTVGLPLGPVADCGEYPLSITIETCNGQANGDPMLSGSGKMNVWPFIPVNRPLVEEYTGLGCGYCPAGYVAMEYMNENLKDRFIGLAYHAESYESNKMETVDSYSFPSYITGFPSGGINRTGYVNPSSFPTRWNEFASQTVEAGVEVSLRWDDESAQRMVATSEVTFVNDMENADYRMGFAIVADNVFNEYWVQKNYYSGYESVPGVESPLWDIFIGGGSNIIGLVFNDVVAYMKEVDGIDNSIPSTIKAGETIVYEYPVNTSDIVNLKGRQFLNPEARLKAVAILFDGKTGHVVNSNKSGYIEWSDTGVDCMSGAACEIVSTVYHTLQGQKVSNPEAGIYLKTDILSDGTRRTAKVLF